MEIVVILLANGFFLSFILLVLLILLASLNAKPEKRAKVREDIKKIKAQINGDT